MNPHLNPLSTTPRRVTREISQLCARIDRSQTPFYVAVKPIADATLEECFGNVKAHIAKNGGAVRYGWVLWEFPKVMAEAEFHAIWSDPTGTLLDITPKRDREDRILFLPDSSRVFENRKVRNLRMALGKDPRIGELLLVVEKMDELLEKYWVDGVSRIPEDEYLPLQREKDRLIADLMPRSPAPARVRVDGRIGRNDPCPCGSGKKFKKCCGAR